MIPIYTPYLPKHALKYAHDALDSTWISSHGKYLDMAQEKLRELLGVKHVILTCNGTCSVHLMAKCLKRFYNGGDNVGSTIKIIVPNNVYIACWNGFLFDKGDYELIPIEADIDTWNYDLDKLDEIINKYPKAACLVVHNVGSIVNTPKLKRKYPDTIFIEDACEGLTGKYEGYWAGSKGFVNAFSFFGNKVLTCGEGSAFVTDSDEAYEYTEHICNQGQTERRFVHDMLGFNFRLTNVQSAVLCGQLDVLPEILEKKQNLFGRYRATFGGREDIKIQGDAEDTQNANWMFPVRIPGSPGYDQTQSFFNSRGIEIRPMFFSINEHEHLKNNPSIFRCEDDIARLVNRESFIIPSYPDLKDDQIGYIIGCIEEYLKGLKQ